MLLALVTLALPRTELVALEIPARRAREAVARAAASCARETGRWPRSAERALPLDAVMAAAGRERVLSRALDTLLEAEFFGVAPGAYTGADRKGREGKFKLADGGTLFLDEIGDMPLGMQAKLLRALQEGEIEPLGSNRLVPFDARVIAATSRDLGALVREGRFRQAVRLIC